MFWFCFGDSVAFSVDHFYASGTSGSKIRPAPKKSPCTFSHDPVSGLTSSSDQDLLIDIIYSKFISLYCTRSPSVDLKEQIKEVKRQAKKEIRTIASYYVLGDLCQRTSKSFYLIPKVWTLSNLESTMNTAFQYGITAIFLQICICYKIVNYY